MDIQYLTLMDRRSDAAGKAHWLDRLYNHGMPRARVFEGFVNSIEFTGICANYGITRGTYSPMPTDMIDDFIWRLYFETLDRRPEEDGLNHWRHELMRGVAGSTVAEGFVFSDEMISLNLSDAEFIGLLYKTLLNRTHDTAGLNHWLAEMSRGATRRDVFHAFAASGEFERLCANHGGIIAK